MTQFILSCIRIPEQCQNILKEKKEKDEPLTILILSILAKTYVVMALFEDIRKFRNIKNWKCGELSNLRALGQGLKALGWRAVYIDTAVAADNLYMLYGAGWNKEVLLTLEESQIASLIDGRFSFSCKAVGDLLESIAQTTTKAIERGIKNIKETFVPPTEEEKAQQKIEALQREISFISRNTITRRTYSLALSLWNRFSIG